MRTSYTLESRCPSSAPSCTRPLPTALDGARELASLTLADALALTALIAKDDPARYGRAAVRWDGRFVLEANRLELSESQLALAALASLPNDEKAALAVLLRIGGRHGVLGLNALICVFDSRG